MESITKKIDRLGRIVLPVDFKKALGLEIGAEVAVRLENNSIVVKGSSCGCRLCGAHTDKSNKLGICSLCIEQIKRI